MPDIDAVIDSDCCEQTKTENTNLKEEIAETLSQLVVRSPNFITVCLCVHLPCAWLDSLSSSCV